MKKNSSARHTIHPYVAPVLLCLFLLGALRGQARYATITGSVLDSDNRPLLGVNVYLRGTILGSATDSEGKFRIDRIPPGEFLLIVSAVGYEEKKMVIRVRKGDTLDVGVLTIQPSPLTSEPIVVTASKYEQGVQDVAASVSTVSEKEIRFRNITRLDQALQYIPGINLNSSQINIRGSSGYSRGVGSRVLMLIDGIPLLTGDTGEINFEAIPINLIDRIEVVKGAGSALYGSSALGGVVNVITRPIPDRPTFFARAYGGWYSLPQYEEWIWTRQSRFLNGQSVNTTRKFSHVGIFLGASRDEDQSYKRNSWFRRQTGTAKLEWEISPFQQLNLFGNYMHQRRGNFLYWRDLSHALEPPADQLDDWVETRRFFLGGNYRYILSQKQILQVRSMWFRNRFDDNVSEGGGNRSTSNNGRLEVQYNTQMGEHFFTAGGDVYVNSATSNIFGNQSAGGGAVYFQDEWPFFSELTATIGGRLDYYTIRRVRSDVRFNPKLSVLYKPRRAMALRASAGLGFRAPSLAELFTSTTAAGLRVIPNINLKPESSVSAEFGWNQVWQNWLVTDLAFFYNRFENLIEGQLLPSAEIQFQNVVKARIVGMEAAVSGTFFERHLTVNLGYTFSDPRDLVRDDYLQFRPRHLLYVSAKANISLLEAGIDYRFISRYDRIDKTFALVVRDADARVAAHIVDARILADFARYQLPVQFSLQLNNLFQYNYVELIGSVAPIRHYVFALELAL